MPDKKVAATTRPRPRPADLRQSALATYREGLPGGAWEAPPPIVAGCISVATILQSATRASSKAARTRMIERAAAIADEFLTPAERAAGGHFDRVGFDSPALRIRALLEKMEEPGIRHRRLEDHVLQSLGDLYPPSTLDGGMILGARASVARFLSAPELTLERALALFRSARRQKDDALLANAWNQIGAYFEIRGNLPRTERAVRRIVKYAERAGDPRLMTQGFIVLGVARGLRGDYEESVRCLWRAYRTAEHPRLRSSALLNLAETLYRSGHYRAARAARAVILQSRPSNTALVISLGGYAVCCSALGDVHGVVWAAKQLEAIAGRYPESRPLAQGLLGGADACGEVGLNEQARALYERGMAMAEARGYHDLRFRPDPTARVVKRIEVQQLEGEAGRARDSIVRMAPHGVAVDYTPVPA
jgi:tetratricopeptide (TPR) repeat protein